MRLMNYIKRFSSQFFKVKIHKIKHIGFKNMKNYITEFNNEDIDEENYEKIYAFLKRYYRKVQKSEEFNNVINFFLKISNKNNELFFYDFVKYLDCHYDKIDYNTVILLIDLAKKINKIDNIRSIINKTFLKLVNNKDVNELDYLRYLFNNNCLNNILFYSFDYNFLKDSYNIKDFKEKLIANNIILNDDLKQLFIGDIVEEIDYLDNYYNHTKHIKLFIDTYENKDKIKNFEEFFENQFTSDILIYLTSDHFYDDVHFTNIIDNLKYFNLNKSNILKNVNLEKYYENLNMSLQLNKNLKDFISIFNYVYKIEDKIFHKKLINKIDIFFEELKNYNEKLLKTQYWENILDLIIEISEPFNLNNKKYFKDGSVDNNLNKDLYIHFFKNANEYLSKWITNSKFDLDNFNIDLEFEINDNEDKKLRDELSIVKEEVSKNFINKLSKVFIILENINLAESKFQLFANELICLNFNKINFNKISFSELMYSIANYNIELEQYLNNYKYIFNYILDNSNNKLEDFAVFLYLISLAKTNKISYYENILNEINKLKNNGFLNINNFKIRLAYINCLILFHYNFNINLKIDFDIDIDELFNYNLKYNKIFSTNRLSKYINEKLLDYCFFKNLSLDNNSYFFNLNFVQNKRILLFLVEKHYNCENIIYKGFTELCIMNLKNISGSNIVIANFKLLEENNKKSKRFEEFKLITKEFDLDLDKKKKFIEEFYFRDLIY